MKVLSTFRIRSKSEQVDPVAASELGAEMMLFQITLNQRDRVISLLNRLNALILRDDLPQNERGDCSLAITTQVAILSNLKPAHGASLTDDSLADEPSGRPVKKAKTADRIVFYINLDLLLDTIRLLLKNEMAAIKHPDSMDQMAKTKLMQENFKKIEHLQELQLPKDEDEQKTNRKMAPDRPSNGKCRTPTSGGLVDLNERTD